jgi:hypothetical protein
VNHTSVRNETKITTCKNCNQAFEGKFCSNCGQEATVGKLDSHFLVHELQHGIFHVDKGILFTLKLLFTEPGKFLRCFIDGKRVGHFKPFAFLVILSGLYAFLVHYVGLVNVMSFYNSDTELTERFQKVTEWNNEHYVVSVLTVLPVSALVCYYIYKKLKITYLEHLVINAYLSGQRFIFSIILLLALHQVNKETGFWLVIVFNILLPFIYFVWSYTQFFAPKMKARYFLYAFSAFVINFMISVLTIQWSLLFAG